MASNSALSRLPLLPLRRAGLFLLLWLGFAAAAGAQNDEFGTGLLEDDEAFEQNVEMMADFSNDGRRALDLPRRVSLRPHAPFPKSQGNINSCIGWAMGYGALTIQKAYREGNTDRKQITDNAYSAMFIYNQVKEGNCLSGAYVHSAAAFLQQNGDCGHRQFDDPPADCLRQPAEDLKSSSKNNAIKDYVALFNRKTDPKTIVMRTKRSVAEGKPVVVGMRIRESLKLLKPRNPIWKPTDMVSDNVLGGHAVCVMGYNDSLGVFEIMNSWGEQWADKGFFFMGYKDFTQYAFQGLQLILPEEELTEEQLATVADLKAEAEASKNAPAPRTKPAAGSTKPAVASTRPKPANSLAKPKPNETTDDPANAASNDRSADGTSPDAGEKPIAKPQRNLQSGNQPARPAIASGNDKPDAGEKPRPKPKPKIQQTAPTETAPPATASSDGSQPASPVADPNAALSGEFVVRQLLADDFGTPILTDDGQYQFQTLAPVWVENHYELSKTDWSVGDMFDVVARNIKKDSYVYLFSLDGKNKAEIHWPRNQRFPEHRKGEEQAGKGEGALVSHSGAEIAIPGNDNVLARENLLADHLCLLNSSRRIDDFQQRVARLRDETNKADDFQARFQAVFGDLLLPSDAYTCAPDAIFCQAQSIQSGAAVPIILKIENK